MTSELSILALYGLLVLVTLCIQASFCLLQLGIPYLSSPRDDQRPVTGTAARADRCLTNSLIAMTFFAPAVLILNAQGISTGNTLLAAQAFLIARVIYVPLYLMGISYVRTAVWSIGFLATAFLYQQAL